MNCIHLLFNLSFTSIISSLLKCISGVFSFQLVNYTLLLSNVYAKFLHSPSHLSQWFGKRDRFCETLIGAFLCSVSLVNEQNLRIVNLRNIRRRRIREKDQNESQLLSAKTN
ncbi:Hypothetical_protein [Hexamita inflata]|uniref:Hypothetical_protein n=1 Tax=Hexamita inflata TaxID=28002 RepID=A0AA86TCL9_9EUKA|nr:Hypothetical protein HINF_LOCUS2609 [Hexamita inflata]